MTGFMASVLCHGAEAYAKSRSCVLRCLKGLFANACDSVIMRIDGGLVL
jgi:hypothetical protein